MYLYKFKLLLVDSDRIEINGKYITFVSGDNEDIIEVELYKLLENWYIIDIEISKIIRKLNIHNYKNVFNFKKGVYNDFCNHIDNTEYIEEICYYDILLFATEDNINIIKLLINKIDMLKDNINEYIKNKRIEAMI